MSCENEGDNTENVPRFLDEIEMVDRKRIKLDNFERKRWSLTDRREDQQILDEMGVGLLEPDLNPGCHKVPAPSVTNKCESTSTSNLENINPNVSRLPASPRSRRSPKVSPRGKHKMSPVRPNRDFVGERAALLSITEEELETTTSCFPLELLEAPGKWPANAQTGSVFDLDPNVTILSDKRDESYCDEFPHSTGLPSIPELPSDCTASSKETMAPFTPSSQSDEGLFSMLSDEVVLSIFKWLPKKTLIKCMLVCRRFHRLATDEWFWDRMDLGGKLLPGGALAWILNRTPLVVRMAGAEIGSWDGTGAPAAPSKIQFLDLSMVISDPQTVNHFLGKCPHLKKLSLEHVQINEETCRIIGKCSNLETLHMSMCEGATAEGLKALFAGCQNLQVLNISWCFLDCDSVNVVCTQAPRRLARLNFSGARRTLTDENVEDLCTRCPNLIELDLSDCVMLTTPALLSVSRLTNLEHLALSRCYNIPQTSLAKLSNCPSLMYVDIFGSVTPMLLQQLKLAMSSVRINEYIHSAIGRPTVGNRRTSVWGIRTRD